ncbi:unnamed protein product [Allacma fusca]|uniref:Uncharacterized protein n=1 Tax=Allacma fusca TaxID=39272 RepID=A0A8J2Q674_9HEXA|nr:unnamed protein product [Allacma fusca]
MTVVKSKRGEEQQQYSRPSSEVNSLSLVLGVELIDLMVGKRRLTECHEVFECSPPREDPVIISQRIEKEEKKSD